MSDIEKIRLFDNQKIRTVWVEEEEEWYFSVKDVVTILTETTNAKDYIAKMRRRDEELSKGWGQIVHPLTIQTAGGPQKENCSTLEGVFRIIQSIPSKKAEPFKQWMAIHCLKGSAFFDGIDCIMRKTPSNVEQFSF